MLEEEMLLYVSVARSYILVIWLETHPVSVVNCHTEFP